MFLKGMAKLKGEKMKFPFIHKEKIVIPIDTSMNISEEDLDYFWAEIMRCLVYTWHRNWEPSA